ncbi:MAG: hypothetical protein K2M97_01250 [Muribaculaceae bacterium]|nr:hypothetical protein [Muribaculaceae bacterium]
MSLEVFAPSYVERTERDGRIYMRRVNLTYHYVFVRGLFADVKRLAVAANGFSLLINHSGGERYVSISDERMTQFKTIARFYENNLPYYSLADVDLESGDTVEVVNGDFKGLVGTYMPRTKSTKGNIVLSVAQNLGTVVYDIKASDVRVLEFAVDSTRANDQIDAFVPRLFQALRYFAAEESLPTSLSTQLNLFCRRMEVVKLTNPKLEAKMLALLASANHIIGNQDAAGRQLGRLDRRIGSVTNPWTQALIDLVLGVAFGSADRLQAGVAVLSAAGEPASRAQRALWDEYSHHVSK